MALVRLTNLNPGYNLRVLNLSDLISNQFVQGTDFKKLKSRSLEFRILQLARDFDKAEQIAESPLHALADLKEHAFSYGENVFEALADFVKK